MWPRILLVPTVMVAFDDESLDTDEDADDVDEDDDERSEVSEDDWNFITSL